MDAAYCIVPNVLAQIAPFVKRMQNVWCGIGVWIHSQTPQNRRFEAEVSNLLDRNAEHGELWLRIIRPTLSGAAIGSVCTFPLANLLLHAAGCIIIIGRNAQPIHTPRA